MRKLRRLLPYLALLLLPLIALAVMLRAGPLAEQARKALESELSRELAREVSIGKASLALSGRVVLRQVVIRNADGSALLTAPRVAARLGRPGSWAPPLSGPTEIREITLVGPELTVTREATGRWSIADLLQRPSRFQGTVLVEDGRLVIVDETREGMVTKIEGASLKLRHPRPDSTVFSLSGRGEEGAFEALEARGDSQAAGVTQISGRISGLDLPYALARLPETSALRVLAGQADVKGEVVFGKSDPRGGPASYQVEAEVSDAKVTFPWLRRPVEYVNGRVRFADGDMHLEDLSGTLVEAPIRAEGTVANLAEPTLALEVNCSGIRYRQLRALFPRLALPVGLMLPSPLRIAARVEGPGSEVKVTGEATVRVIKFRAIPWNDLVGRFEYSGGRLSITGLHAHGSPRKIEAELEVDLRKGRGEARGTVSMVGVPLGMLAEMAGRDATGIEGVADVRATVRADGQKHVTGSFVLQGANVRGLELGRVTGEFELSHESLQLRSCQVRGPAGEGSFAANLSLAGACEVEARFSLLDLSALGPMLKVAGLRGQCCATAQLRGQLGGARLAGWLDLGPGEVQGRAFKRLRADLQMTPTSISVSHLLLSLGDGEYRGDAEITDWQEGREHARVTALLTAEGAGIREWLPPGYAALAPGGRMDGSAEVTGTLADPDVRLDLRLQSVAVAGQPLQSGRARARYEHHRLVIEEMFLEDRGTHLSVGGDYDPETGLSLEVIADPFDLSGVATQARSKYGLALAGKVRARALVTGSPASPRIEVQGSSESLSVNDVSIDQLVFAGTGGDGMIGVKSVALRQGESRIALSGDIDLRRETLDLSLGLENLDLAALLMVADRAVWRLYRSGVRSPHFATYTRMPRPLRGKLNAEVRIAGTVQEPQAAVDLKLEDLGFAGRQISRIEGKVTLWLGPGAGHLFSLRKAELALLASHEMAHASVSGQVSPAAELSLVVDIGNLDLRLLGPWLSYPVELGGLATINFDISGPAARPALRGDVFVDDLRLGSLEIEAATASPIHVERGILTLEEIRLRNGPMEAVGTASFPLFSSNAGSGPAGAAPPKAELHLTKASFAPLAGMVPAVFDADFYLVGKRLLLHDRNGATASEPGPGIRGKMGSGSFAVAGEVLLRELKPSGWDRNQFQVDCELHGVDLVLPEMVNAKLDGRLLLTNSPKSGRALLTTAPGKPLALSHATLGMPRHVRLLGREIPLFAPEVEVRVLVGERVRFRCGAEGRPTEIKLDPGRAIPEKPASGYLDIGGELSAHGLTLEGQLEAHEGQLAFPNGVLTLRSGRAWVERAPGEPPHIRVSAEAQGRVGDYYLSLNPTGQLYPLADAQHGGGESPPLALNAASIPYLEPAFVMALLAGPVVAPTRGGSADFTALLDESARGSAGGGEITGIMIPPLGSALGRHEVSLDVAFQGPTRLRLGERVFERFLVSYVSSLGGAKETRTLRVTYEVTPLWSVGWSVDELDRTRWEAEAFVPF